MTFLRAKLHTLEILDVYVLLRVLWARKKDSLRYTFSLPFHMKTGHISKGKKASIYQYLDSNIQHAVETDNRCRNA